MTEEVETKVQEFITYIIQRKNGSSYDIARRTILLMREIVSKSKWTNPRELIERVRRDGKRIIIAQPGENAVYNMVQRGIS
jgi:translation initiation factor eIF-2B subunit beta